MWRASLFFSTNRVCGHTHTHPHAHIYLVADYTQMHNMKIQIKKQTTFFKEATFLSIRVEQDNKYVSARHDIFQEKNHNIIDSLTTNNTDSLLISFNR